MISDAQATVWWVNGITSEIMPPASAASPMTKEQLRAEKLKLKYKRYYARHREEANEKSRLYRIKNKEAMKEKDRAYRLANKERLREKSHAYVNSHKEAINSRRRNDRISDPESIRSKERTYYAANRERELANKRKSSLKIAYGMTVAEWNELFLSQNSCCAICRSTESGNRYWHVDHCHTTGVIRGILCHHCNLVLGQAKDRIEVLERAASYLAKFKTVAQAEEK